MKEKICYSLEGRPVFMHGSDPNNSGPIPVVAVFPMEYILSYKQHHQPPVFTKVFRATQSFIIIFT
jgi:hypothetical protein